jgi:hypothetical protein
MIGLDGGGDSPSSLNVCTVIFTSYKEYTTIMINNESHTLLPRADCYTFIRPVF